MENFNFEQLLLCLSKSLLTKYDCGITHKTREWNRYEHSQEYYLVSTDKGHDLDNIGNIKLFDMWLCRMSTCCR